MADTTLTAVDLFELNGSVAALEEAGFKTYLHAEHSLEVGRDGKVLQIIQLENGEWRASEIFTDGSDSKSDIILPEIGEVAKWLEGHI